VVSSVPFTIVNQGSEGSSVQSWLEMPKGSVSTPIFGRASTCSGHGRLYAHRYCDSGGVPQGTYYVTVMKQGDEQLAIGGGRTWVSQGAPVSTVAG